MGSNFSIMSGGRRLPSPPAAGVVTAPDAADLASYLTACQLDPDVRVFDSRLHDRTVRVMGSLSNGAEVRSLPFESIRDAADSLMDVNMGVVKLILECKKDIWNDEELFGLVDDYFKYSINTLEFFSALEKCLMRARDRQLILQSALHRFEEETKNGGVSDGGISERYSNTLHELRNFKEAGDPFTEEFFGLVQTVQYQQMQMYERLQRKKHKLDKKLRKTKIYRKVSNVIFAATFIALIICSVVAAVIAAPPIVTALAAAASAPLGGLGKWFNSLWNKYEKDLKDQLELVRNMKVTTYITIQDLDSVRQLVEKLEIKIESLLTNAGFTIQDEDVVVMVMEEIKDKVDPFMKAVEELVTHADKYSRDVRRARTLILNKIIKYPSH